jgi:hypothetical protein
MFFAKALGFGAQEWVCRKKRLVEKSDSLDLSAKQMFQAIN